MFFRMAAMAAALVGLSAVSASAQSEPVGLFQQYRPPPAGTSDTFVVTLSGTAAFEPRFPGSDKATVNFLPSLSYRRSDEPRRFAAVDDGASISIIDDPSFRFGPVFRVQAGRYLDDDRRLFGLRKLGWDVEPGVFVEYWPLTFLRARAEIRHGFRDGTGFVGNAGVDLVAPVEQFVFSIGPRVYFGDDRYVDRYFGVRPGEAVLNPRLFAFKPDGGLTGVGGLGAVTYRWNETWATTAFVNYKRLVNDVADSPIVTRIGSPDQFSVGLRVSYSFTYNANTGLGGL